MEKIVAYIKEKLKRNYEEKIVKGNDLVGLEKDIRRYVESITKETLKSFLEDYDEAIKLDKKREKRYIVQRSVSKTIISTLGTFKLNRTKYYDKEDKRYFCMLDEKLGIPAYERFTVLATSRMLKEATNTNYKRAGEEINESDVISKGTVYNKIKRLEVEEKCEESKNKRKVRVLYINLDEDHISLQKAKEKKILGKIGYVYEGTVKECKNRYRLTYKHTICGTYQKSSGNRTFYELINKYIYNNYDIEYLDKVIVYGDGANWIKASTDYIYKSEFRIDKFHLSKYIQSASYTIRGNKHLLKQNIYKCLYEENKEKFINLMNDAIDSSNNVKIIKETREYIINNWEAIMRTIFAVDGNCSAEGNVSHTLSARMSQKGLGWSEHNADQICRLRGIQANHGNEIFIEVASEYFKSRMSYISNDKQLKALKPKHYDIVLDSIDDKRYIERMQVEVPQQIAKRISILGTNIHLN